VPLLFDAPSDELLFDLDSRENDESACTDRLENTT
jgi:hypothetical protein